MLVLPEPGRVEDVELGLGTPVGGVGDAGRLQVGLGLLGDVARVAVVGLAGQRVVDKAIEQKGLASLGTDHRPQRSASGIRSMSDSWMAWKPRIDEPSNP